MWRAKSLRCAPSAALAPRAVHPTREVSPRHQRRCVSHALGGLPRQLMQAGRVRQLTLISRVPMLDELTGVLGRPKFAAKVSASPLGIDALVDAYAALALLVHPAPIPRVAPDPDDDVVLGTALAGRADAVVTGDKALLSVLQYQGVRLLTVKAAVALLDACARVRSALSLAQTASTAPGSLAAPPRHSAASR